MYKNILLASALAFAAISPAVAADKYTLDSSHSQAVFNYNHLGFSTTYGMFSGFAGEIMFDEADPAASSVDVSIDTSSLITGWEARTGHFLTGDFFDAENAPKITFKSTSIEVTGDKTANITGDLTLNGITKPVVLDTTLNQQGEHPMAKQQWLGFDATTTIVRSDFDMGQFAPFVADDVKLHISVEAMLAQ